MARKKTEDDRRFEEYTKITYKCKHCGCSVTIPDYMDKVICRVCGYFVFRTPKDEFMFRVGNFLKSGD